MADSGKRKTALALRKQKKAEKKIAKLQKKIYEIHKQYLERLQNEHMSQLYYNKVQECDEKLETLQVQLTNAEKHLGEREEQLQTRILKFRNDMAMIENLLQPLQMEEEYLLQQKTNAEKLAESIPYKTKKTVKLLEFTVVMLKMNKEMQEYLSKEKENNLDEIEDSNKALEIIKNKTLKDVLDIKEQKKQIENEKETLICKIAAWETKGVFEYIVNPQRQTKRHTKKIEKLKRLL